MKRPIVVKDLTVTRVATLTGLSAYTVDYLCRSGTLKPSLGATKPGRGAKRKYSFSDVVLLRALATLLKQGLPVSRLKVAVRQWQQKHPDGLPGRYLVTDGRNVYWNQNGSIENLTAKGQLAFGFVLELQRLQQEVLTKAKELGFVSDRK